MVGISDALHIGPESVLRVRLVLDHSHCAVSVLQHVAALDAVSIAHLPRGLVVSRLRIFHTVLVPVVRNVLKRVMVSSCRLQSGENVNASAYKVLGHGNVAVLSSLVTACDFVSRDGHRANRQCGEYLEVGEKNSTQGGIKEQELGTEEHFLLLLLLLTTKAFMLKTVWC